MITIPFTEPWEVLSPEHPGFGDAFVQNLEMLGPEAQAIGREYVDTFDALLRDRGLAALASLALPDPDPNLAVYAWCAVAWAPLDTPPNLDALLLATPYATVDLRLSDVRRNEGALARKAVAVRAGRELSNQQGHWPYVLVCRYAIPVDAHTAALLHFESFSIGYRSELEDLFDALVEGTSVS